MKNKEAELALVSLFFSSRFEILASTNGTPIHSQQARAPALVAQNRC